MRLVLICLSVLAFGCGTTLPPDDGGGGQGGAPPACDEGEVCTDVEALCEECFSDGCNDCTTPVCELDCVDEEAVCESCKAEVECPVCPEPECYERVPGECRNVCVQERYGRCCQWEKQCSEDTFERIPCPDDDEDSDSEVVV